MKAPKNMKKVLETTSYNFSTKGRGFRIEVAEYDDELTGVFIFEKDRQKDLAKLEHCLLFRMHWTTEKYEIVMPEVGAGDQGNQVGSGRIDRQDCLTPTDFVRMLEIWTKNLLLKNVLV